MVLPSLGKNAPLWLCLIAAALFGCLLWAVHLVESRSSSEQTIHSWKRLDSFVRVYISPTIKQENVSTSYVLGLKRIYTTDLPAITSTYSAPLDESPYHITPSNYNGTVYMDWIGDSDDFGYINYKNLESLLTVYPRANIIIHLIASNGAQYYKMGNLISKHFFQKYLKYGYNVQVKIKYTTFATDWEADEALPLGAAYWNTQFLQCCTSERAADINKYRTVPTHMYFYLRLLELYKNGGVYSDFSWYHRQSMAPHTGSAVNNSTGEGALIHLSCYTNNNTHTNDINTGTDVIDEPCMYRSSTLLMFKKDSAVLQCILLQYNHTESALLQCIEHDALTDGALCVKNALLDCFASTKSVNIFDHLHDLIMLSGTIGKPSPVIWLGPSSYNGDWSLFKNNIIDKYIQKNPLSVPGPYYKCRLVERNVHSTIPYVPYPLRVLGAVTSQEQHYIHLLNTRKVTHIPPESASNTCSHFQYDTSFSVPSHMQNQAKLSCAPHFVIPGFMKAGTTYMFGTLMTHPMLLNALKGVTFKETGCYGSQYTTLLKKNNVVRNSLASVYSTAYDAYIAKRQTSTTTGNNSLTTTEVKKLQDTFQKGIHRLQSTTNRYYNRMDCFPFVEAHEKVHFGDGTVWYNSHKNIPATLLQDNPNIKVLFSIRNPAARAESHHRFSYRTLVRLYTGDLNEIVQYLLHNTSNQHYAGTSLYELRQQAVQILHTTDPVLRSERIESLVTNFQHAAPGDKKYKMLNQYLKFGIYFVPIYYWYKKIPAGHIAVLPVETLQPHKLSEKEKLSYLYNLTTLDQYNRIYHTHTTNTNTATRDRASLREKYAAKRETVRKISDENKRTQLLQQLTEEQEEREEKINRKQAAALNNEYLVQQYNRIFRFLELPEMTSITEADSHLTGDKDILPEHKLSQESKRLLEDYFEPFNMLLEEFLGESVGFR